MEQRFGEEQVCSVGTYTTLQLKAALTDFAKLYGVDIPTIRRISKMINGLDDKTFEDFMKIACKRKEMKNFVNKYPELINAIFLVLGQPKAASIHACAMMIFPKEKTMFQWTPIRKQNDLMVSEWEGGELDATGFLKEDILGIEQLDKFTDMINLIEKDTGKRINLYRDIRLDDSKVYKAFQEGQSADLFHFGAKGLSKYVLKVAPENIDDLIACVCLYRPGPMENGYHISYLKRRSGEEEIDYPIGGEDILKDSYGLFYTQEHIMLLCQKLAGFSLPRTDDVRKCIWGEERVWTQYGAIRMKDLKSQMPCSIATFDKKNFGVKYNRVVRSFSTGKKKCIRIITQGDYSITCTPDHKIMTEIGWIEAKDCLNHYIYKDFSRKCGSLEVSQEELYLMTALVTEGSLGTPGKCNFVNKDERELDEFERCYEVVFGSKLKRCFNKKTECYSFNIKDEDVLALGLDFCLSEQKRLPEYVFSLNDKCQRYVLAKLIDFDGYIASRESFEKLKDNKSGSFLIGYSSKSKELISQVRELLSCIGVYTTTNKRSFKQYPDSYYDIGISNIDDALRVKKYLEEYSFKIKERFSFTKKDFKEDSFNTKMIPFEIWQPIIKSLIDNSGYTCNELLGSNILNYGINHKCNLSYDRLRKILSRVGRNKYLEKLLDSDSVCLLKVKSIEEIEEPLDVYEFTMTDGCISAAFVGGILVHNCMGKKIISKLQKIEPEFIKGYVERYGDQGVDEEYAKKLWKSMEEFGKYAFNKSHAAAYSINGYNSMWFKVHYPVEFWSVTFSRASKDDYPFYIAEINKSRSIRLKSVDINKSDINIVVDKEDQSLYWPLNSVTQVGEKAQIQISNERKENGPYFSLDEFIDRHSFKGSSVNKSVIENLIYAGAFDEIEKTKESPYFVREKLIVKYREDKRIKINEEKDSYSLAKEDQIVDEDWWWQLKQKRASGYCLFDYESLCEEYLDVKDGVFCDCSDLENYEEPDFGTSMIGGYVLECEIKESKKGTFANLIIESNYNILKVVVWADIFDDVKKCLEDCEKNILLLNGKIVYSNYDEQYVLQTVRSTKIVKLSLL